MAYFFFLLVWLIGVLQYLFISEKIFYFYYLLSKLLYARTMKLSRYNILTLILLYKTLHKAYTNVILLNIQLCTQYVKQNVW